MEEKREELKCTCNIDPETIREIGHFLNCPRAKIDKTWWQEKEIQNKNQLTKRIKI